ncbi:MAG: PEP-CTERM sorting domain-containing protein [Phycisphaerales bacterium]|nr:MAG: PEP-CTERM sorting domain-containing protein [Phycisphaerales bacterium]
MRNGRGKTVLTIVAAILLALSASAGAAPVPIDNPGFEDPVLADGDWSWSMDDQGWGYFGNDGYQGSWNVTTAEFPGEAAEGQNVGWAEGEGYLGGFAQVLTDPDARLKAGMTYTLTVEVGYALSTDPFGGYMVQLLAGGTPHTPGTGGDYTGAVTGGTLLAEDDNLLTIAQGTFETSTVTYTYNPALHSGLLGEPLQIRLIAYAASDEVEFDDVRLDAIPEPATLALLGLGALMLRRKRP